MHPFAAPLGELNAGERYALTEDEYGDIARSQLVCALQIHVAVGGADRTLAVYNGLRPWLPLVAALAANAPFHAGRDTGLASIRPKIGEQLPRQGIPPTIASWDAFAAALAWGAASGAVPEPRRWWWELRPHPVYGTLEVRVPDAQSTVAEAGAVVALVHTLIAWLSERHDAGSRSPAPTRGGWRRTAGARRAGAWTRSSPTSRRASAVPARACLEAPARRPRAGGGAARLGGGARGRGAPGGAQRRRPPARAGRRGRSARDRRVARGRLRAERRLRPRRRGKQCAVLTLPTPRGATTEALLAALRAAPHQLPPIPLPAGPDPLADEDLQLALYCCYELHYRGLPGVDERWEWSPSLLALRAALEARFEAALRDEVGAIPTAPAPAEMDVALRAIADADEGPSLSRHVERDATLDQVLEFLAHRSAYQLKEADPHSWAIPRLSGPPKAALVEIQADEYGGGRPERVHAQLFADAMAALGLDARYGAYLDLLPAETLATVNLMSLCGLHRRLRGAIVGHLALFEMTSSIPNRRYATGLRRLGVDDPAATAFFDEHVEADAVHEAVAAVDLAGGLARLEPALARDILWGASALVAVEARWARRLLDAWEEDRTSLLRPLPGSTLDAFAPHSEANSSTVLGAGSESPIPGAA